MHQGPRKAYIPLQTIPGAPHIEVPLYRKENAGMAKKLEMIKKIMELSVIAPPRGLNSRPRLPSIRQRTGSRMIKLAIPEVHWWIVMPMLYLIKVVPNPATAPSMSQPSAQTKARPHPIRAEP